jgi:hypothetical protein
MKSKSVRVADLLSEPANLPYIRAFQIRLSGFDNDVTPDVVRAGVTLEGRAAAKRAAIPYSIMKSHGPPLLNFSLAMQPGW